MSNSKQNLRSMKCLDILLMAMAPHEALRLMQEASPLPPRYPLIGSVPPMHGVPTELASGDNYSLRRFQRRHGWSIDVAKLLRRPYDALVLTDVEHRIQWVSSGFRRMTGHAAKTVLGRTPGFLQGPATLPRTLMDLNEALIAGRTVSTELTNYRKNGTTYLCAVDITPLRTTAGHITHYIALEKERT